MRPGEHAIVLGAGFSGLCAARVLAARGLRVTLVERDLLTLEPGPRAGTPQARHAHGLLARGCEVLERLFPELVPSLARLGVHRVDWGRDFAVYDRGWLPREEVGVSSLACSRDRLEHAMRESLLERGEVRLEAGTRARGLLFDANGGVAGVDSQRGPLPAHWVLDAMGRSSPLLRWLAPRGVAEPLTTRVVSGRAYATRHYRGLAKDWSALLGVTSPPDVTRGVIVYPTESDWDYVTLVGTATDAPPRDPGGFEAFARSLPPLWEALERADPFSPVWCHRDTETRYRHVEVHEAWPERLLVVGDALCALNPVHAQGMSVATLCAEALDDVLAAGSEGVTRRYHRAAYGALADALTLAVAEDLRWCTPPQSAHPTVPRRLAKRVRSHLDAIDQRDVAARSAYLRLWHLLDPLPAHLRARPVSSVHEAQYSAAAMSRDDVK
ncbi:MAG: FAD-dependent oxidoreductase [Sandaracinaceae bacterium]